MEEEAKNVGTPVSDSTPVELKGQDKMDTETKDIEAAEAKIENASVDDTKSMSTESNHEDTAEKLGNATNPKAKRNRMFALITMLVIVILLAIGLSFALSNESSALRFGFDCDVEEYNNTTIPSKSSNSSEASVTVIDIEDSEVPTYPKGTVMEDKQTTWPELVGLLGVDAKQLLLQRYGDTYNIVIVEFGSYTTKDIRDDRIFLFLDESGRVKTVPRVG
jgi:Potato inhibitor I family